jgi:hypothetical protein
VIGSLAASLSASAALAACITEESPPPSEGCANGGFACFDASGLDVAILAVDALLPDTSTARDSAPPTPDATLDSGTPDATTPDANDAALPDAADSAAPPDAADAGGPVVFISGQSKPTHVAAGGGYVYWSNAGDTTLWRLSASGGTASKIVFTPASNVVALIADGTRAYFATAGGSVFEVPHKLTDASPIASGQPNVTEMSTDGTDVYWVTYVDAGVVGRAPGGGGADASVLSPTLQMPHGITVANGKVYVSYTAGLGNDVIAVVASDGGAPAPLVQGLHYPWRLNCDGANIFWTEDDSINNPALITRAPLDGGASTLMSNTAIHPFLMLDNQWLYTLSNDTLSGFNGIIAFDLSAGGKVHPGFTFQYNVGGLAVDATSLYWTDLDHGNVMKAPR